jgi:hypothetical protein
LEGLLDGGIEPRGLLDPGHPNRRPGVCRLDENGIRQRGRPAPDLVAVVAPVAVSHRDEVDDRQTGVAQDPLLHVLVHSQSRAQDAGADVGDLRQLEESLDRTVLAPGAVQKREDDVQPGQQPTFRCDRQQLAARGPGSEGHLAGAVLGHRVGGWRRQPQELDFRMQVPSTLGVDADQDGVVFFAVERLEDGPGRAQGDVVLARAPAVHDTEPEGGHAGDLPRIARPVHATGALCPQTRTLGLNAEGC